MTEDTTNSEERIRRATEWLWRFWWFAWYLIIAPLIVGILFYFLIRYIIIVYFTRDPYVVLTYPLAFALLVFMFALLFFFKPYDKYRKKSFFQNQKNNLAARINILFIITTLSLSITPIFIAFSPKEYSFELLPLISFIILYNIIWYYFYFEPIDFFGQRDRELKHIPKVKTSIIQPHNFIILINYIVQILFLSITFYTKYSWLFGLITNAAFYGITLTWTRKVRTNYLKEFQKGRIVHRELTDYHQKFVISIFTLIFCFLIQLPLIMLFFGLKGVPPSRLNYILSTIIVAILLCAYFKSMIYIFLYYNSRFKKILEGDSLEAYKKAVSRKFIIFNKSNSYLSILLIAIILLISFLLNLPIFGLLALPFFYVLYFFEKSTTYLEKKEVKFVHFLTTLAILIEICFGFLFLTSEPLIWYIFVIVFLIALYFTLEAYVKLQFFEKNNVILVQNVLAIAIFFVLAYIFYPIFFLGYVDFTSNLIIISLSRFLFIGFLFTLALLFSFYRLYVFYFFETRTKWFRIIVLVNLLSIEAFLFALIIIRLYFLVALEFFIKLVILSLILFPALFLAFLFVNYIIGVLSPKRFLFYAYYTSWSLISVVFLAIEVVFFLNYVVMLLGAILFSVLFHYQLKFGLAVEKLKKKLCDRYRTINSYALTAELFFFFFFNFLFSFDALLSIFFSLCLICVLVGILSNKKIIFPKIVRLTLISSTIFYGSFLMFYYTFIFFYPSIFILFSVLLLAITMNLPVYYLTKEKALNLKIQSHFRFYILCVIAATAFLQFFLIIFEFAPILFYTGIFHLLNALFLTISLHYLFKFGCLLKKFSELTFNKASYIIYWAASLEFFSLLLILFSLGLNLNLLLSSYISLLIICVIVNLLSERNRFFTKPFSVKLNIITLIFNIIVITTYSVYYTYGTYLLVAIPAIFTCISLYLLLFYLRMKKVRLGLANKALFYNSLVLATFITLLPTLISLELLSLGVLVDIVLTAIATLLLIFVLLKISERFSSAAQIKPIYIVELKLTQIFAWLTISILVVLELIGSVARSTLSEFIFLVIPIVFLLFFILNIYNLIQFKHLISLISKLEFKRFKEKILSKIFDYCVQIVYLGIIFFTSLTLTINNYNSFLIDYFGFFWYLWAFFGSLLILLSLGDQFLVVAHPRANEGIKLTSWFVVKITICAFFMVLSPFSIFNKICLFIFLFTLLSPFSIYYLKRFEVKIVKENQYFIIGALMYVFLASILCFYIEAYLNIVLLTPTFQQNPLIIITILLCNIFLFSNFWLLRFNFILEQNSVKRLFYHNLIGLLLIICLLFFIPTLAFLLLFIIYPIVLSSRNKTYITRLVCYFSLSFLTFVSIFAFFNLYTYLFSNSVPFGFYVCIYLLMIVAVLISAILLNWKTRNNTFEELGLYGVISGLSFVFLTTFTTILQYYALTISIFILLLLYGMRLHRIEDPRYKWFLKPCVLLIVFNFVSWLSYSFLFINSDHYMNDSILTFTLTISITSYSFILLYNNAPEKFRNDSFFYALISTIISVPMFVYFLLVSYFPIPIEQPIALIIAVNIGILLFYISIGIYQWKLSLSIWKTGWWMWNVLPIVNFYIIYRVISEVDVYANALKILGDFDALIFTVIVCTVFELPALYTWVKEHINRILFVVWGESLFIVYWISQNIFWQDALLNFLSFFLFALVLLMPLLYKIKLWSILSKLWLILMGINVWFSTYLLWLIGLNSVGILFSLGINIVGLFMLIYSFFPNLRFKAFYLVISYITLLTGIFLIIFLVMSSIILHPIISFNIASIVLAGTLFSSKYLKFDKIKTHFIISIILIANFSLLTFFSFSLVPGLEIFALFLAITVGGGSVFVFNRYEMFKPHINSGIPWMIMSVGTSSSLASLLFIFLKTSPLLIAAIWIAINLVFLYFVLEQYGTLMWFLFPVPIALLYLNWLLTIEAVSSIWLLCLMMFYFVFLQIEINVFNKVFKRINVKIKASYLELYKDPILIKVVNLTLFLINSTYISLFITLVSTTIFMNRIVYFLILWPILTLCCLKYVQKSKLLLKFKKSWDYLDRFSSILYLLIPIAITILPVALFVQTFEYDIIHLQLVFLSLITFGGILFLESYIIDYCCFRYLLTQTRSSLSLWSWIVFCNSLSFYVFFVLLGTSGLNLRTVVLLLPLILSFVNLMSGYLFSQRYTKKIKTYPEFRKKELLILAFTFSLFIASLISDGFSFLFVLLSDFSVLVLYFLNTSLCLFLLSRILNRKRDQILNNKLEFALFIGVQAFFGVFWLVLFGSYNILGAFTLFVLIFIELRLSFVLIPYLYDFYLSRKDASMKRSLKNCLNFSTYITIALVFFSLYNQILNVITNLLISCIIVFFLVLADIRREQRALKFEYFFSLMLYILISILLFVDLWQFVEFVPELGGLFLIIFLSMQFVSIYGVNKLSERFISAQNSSDRIKNTTLKIQKGLINAIFILVSMYVSWIFTNAIIIVNIFVAGIPSVFLLLQLVSLILFFVYSGYKLFFNEISNYILKSVLYGAFITFFGAFWFSIFIASETLSFFSLWLVIILVTAFSFYLTQILLKILNKQKGDKLKEKIGRIFHVLFEIEIGFLLFGAFYLVLDIIISLFYTFVVLFVLNTIEIRIFKKENLGFSYMINAILYIGISVLLLVILALTFISWNIWILIAIIITTMQFLTIHLVFKALISFYPQNSENYKTLKMLITSCLGALLYTLLGSLVIQYLFQAPIELQLLIVAIFIHGISLCDQYILKFLGKKVVYPKLASWLTIIGTSLYYIVLATSFYLLAIPWIILFVIFEFVYLIKIIEGLKKMTLLKVKLYQLLGILAYLDFITWPLYMTPFNAFIFLNLLLGSFTIAFFILHFDSYLKLFKEGLRKRLQKLSFLMIGAILSVDAYLGLTMILHANFYLSLSVALLIFTAFSAIVVKPFTEHSSIALCYWGIIFTLLSIIIYNISLSSVILTFFIVIAVLLYPFVFFMEEIRELFNKFLESIIKAIQFFKKKVKLLFNQMKLIWSKFKRFVKKNFKPIWITISIILTLMVAYFIWPYLIWYHTAGICAAVFGLLYSVIPSKETSDPNVLFKRRMTRLIIVWLSVILVIFNFIPFDWIILSTIMAVLILGAILLPYIYHKEKVDNISIKWRFYTLVFLIIVLIIFSILLYAQLLLLR